MPASDEASQRAYPRVSGELSQCIHRENLGRLQLLFYAGVFGIRRLTAHYLTGSTLKVQETERLSELPPLPAQPLLEYDGAHSLVLPDLQVVGDERCATTFPVLQFDHDWIDGAARTQFLKP